MNVERKEIVTVLEAVLAYLNITLPCQSLSPDAEMGRETLVNRVQSLADKLGASPSTSVESLKNDAAVDEELYDDVANSNAGTLDAVDGNNSVATPPQAEDYEVPGSQEDALVEDLNYEVAAPEKSDVVELLEEEEYDDVVHLAATGDLGFELTEEALVEKLKRLESTSPKNILYGSLFSGWLLKQKKKLMSKWHKRYCILRDQFLFYYQSESDLKSLGVIVLPGYSISEEKSSSKDKFIFKLVASGKGRSTYSFQVASKTDYDAWLSVLHGICSQKLNRLSSDACNRVAKRMDEESENGSAGGSTKLREKPILEGEELYDDCVEGGTDPMNQQQGEGEDLYETVDFAQQPSDIPPRAMQNSLPPPVPSPALSPRQPANFQRRPDEALYDDHVDHIDAMPQQSAAVPAEDLYEGIPGEDYQPEGGHPPPIQEDLYEDIAPFQQSVASPIPPRPPTTLPPPIDAAPSLPPARSPNIPERRPVGQGNESFQPPPLPPPIPGRGERQKESKTELKEDKPDVPAEDDFSYENVYIGTKPYVAKEEDELAFNRGDLIYILQKVNSNWWIGCMDKKVGLVPSDLLIAGFAH